MAAKARSGWSGSTTEAKVTTGWVRRRSVMTARVCSVSSGSPPGGVSGSGVANTTWA
nr:hypothetical protein [Propionibacterium sp.]